jgi:anaerobic magnesium-protoporphyrin IX monomethyl ester cyclase
MKVLFIWTLISSKAKFHPGIASLSAVLKEKGHSTDLLEFLSLDFSLIDERIESFGPDIIGLSANSHQFIYVREIINYISRRYENIRLILGGIHVTLNPEDIKMVPGVDAVCKGEGELPLLKYVESIVSRRLDTDIENIDFMRDTLIVNPTSFYVKNLDELPPPDYSVFRYFRGVRKVEVPVRFFFNRGCPFNCSYCCNHALRKLFPNPKRYVRFMSVDRVIEQMLLVAQRWEFDEYEIDDDIFTLDKRWFLEFCRKYPIEMKAKRFGINVRIGTMDEEMVKALSEINCSLVKIGVESGSYRIRREVLGRTMKDEQIRDVANLLKKYRIPFFTFNMIGVPGEARGDIWKTIKLNQLIRPDSMQLTVYYPYQHTVLGDKCFKENLVSKTRSDSYFKESIISSKLISKLELNLVIQLFKYLIYRKYNREMAREERKQLLRWLLAYYVKRPLRMVKRAIKLLSCRQEL